ncbi:MAG: cell division ATP-binding protein FtsE [Clostridia bacterium]|nr:cell division ATP-binding protein FtsE [Clostridia bacterium]MBR2452924.1 cell division ATP-binding protein FtsE [Clostridia bacterium]
MIEFKNVSKTYEDTGVKALSDVSFSIEKGEFVFLVGRSGAGKSTLSKLIIKEESPDEGEIFVDKFELNTLAKKEIPYLRRSVGMMFQDFRLLPNKTVYENVAFAMQVIGASRGEIRRNVPNVLNLVGLGHKARMLPSQLSGGEQQRVSLARALVNKPPVIIADEPTANLDPDTSVQIMELLAEVNQRGTTMIVTTHAKDFVDTMHKRVLEFRDGVLIRDEKEGAY